MRVEGRGLTENAASDSACSRTCGGEGPPALRAGSDCLSSILNLCWTSPKSGDVWYRSRQLKIQFALPTRAGGRHHFPGDIRRAATPRKTLRGGISNVNFQDVSGNLGQALTDGTKHVRKRPPRRAWRGTTTLIGFTSCIVKAFGFYRSFISSPRWTPRAYGPRP